MFIAKMGQSESYVVYVIPWERGRKVLTVCLNLLLRQDKVVVCLFVLMSFRF